ncbi:MAG: FAD-binding oxidoreductase [Fimbriimonadaceae bacterium]|nr:FAD-binding oxidoreductase [Fimbriimonadaceae bacterium]
MIERDRIVRLSGFGGSQSADGFLYRPGSLDAVSEVLALARREGRQVVLRGAGRSYGDAAVAGEAVALDLSRMDNVRSFDPATGVIDVGPGATIEALWRHTLEDGWWPSVVSGTMYPTVAGALAMNIHGKNAFRVGTLGENTLSVDVLRADGSLVTLGRDDPGFTDVVSGAGLLGVVVGARLQMKRVTSGALDVEAVSCADWDAQFEAFTRHEATADYMVSWLDAFASGPSAGRGVFHAARHRTTTDIDIPSLRPDAQDLPDTIMGLVPKSVVWRFLKPLNNRVGMRFVNWAKHTSGVLMEDGKSFGQSLVAFSFLLDYVPGWQRAYDPGGLVQYQSFVPREAAPRVFARQFEIQRERGLENFLSVLKLHRPDPFMFSHGVDGFSLAQDFKVTTANREGLRRLAETMSDLVLEAGGRFYLAKDSLLRPTDFAQSLGEAGMARYWAAKAAWDPDALFSSSLARRLQLDPRCAS